MIFCAIQVKKGLEKGPFIKKNYRWVNAINRFLAIKTILPVEKSHDYRLFSGEEPKDRESILGLAEERI